MPGMTRSSLSHDGSAIAALRARFSLRSSLTLWRETLMAFACRGHQSRVLTDWLGIGNERGLSDHPRRRYAAVTIRTPRRISSDCDTPSRRLASRSACSSSSVNTTRAGRLAKRTAPSAPTKALSPRTSPRYHRVRCPRRPAPTGTRSPIPAVEEALYGEKGEILERYGWDPSLGGAHLLGSAVRAIALPPSKRIVSHLLDDRIEGRRMESLEYEMCRKDFGDSELERVARLLSAFRDGFF
jgi:hypothetical protein